jgi:sugar/nucleoside kinase (ribokinase family)
MKTSIDMVSEKSGRVAKIVRAALRFTDYCTINELEAEAVSGICLCEAGSLIRNTMRPVLEQLAGYGVSEWVIVHASSCSFGLDCHSGKAFLVPNLDLPGDYIRGKTGAGDAYCSGVLYSVYTGKTILEAMKLGTACASCSLSEVNGTDGMRGYDDVCALYNHYRGDSGYETI